MHAVTHERFEDRHVGQRREVKQATNNGRRQVGGQAVVADERRDLYLRDELAQKVTCCCLIRDRRPSPEYLGIQTLRQKRKKNTLVREIPCFASHACGDFRRGAWDRD